MTVSLPLRRSPSPTFLGVGALTGTILPPIFLVGGFFFFFLRGAAAADFAGQRRGGLGFERGARLRLRRWRRASASAALRASSSTLRFSAAARSALELFFLGGCGGALRHRHGGGLRCRKPWHRPGRRRGGLFPRPTAGAAPRRARRAWRQRAWRLAAAHGLFRAAAGFSARRLGGTRACPGCAFFSTTTALVRPWLKLCLTVEVSVFFSDSVLGRLVSSVSLMACSSSRGWSVVVTGASARRSHPASDVPPGRPDGRRHVSHSRAPAPSPIRRWKGISTTTGFRPRACAALYSLRLPSLRTILRLRSAASAAPWGRPARAAHCRSPAPACRSGARCRDRR